ncbi:hypothetical protein [Xanthobacter wiegelii]|uniref:hypothetical protein n=1 Tax=Xanthobacter wiegelii TaxID=3119913 RepID=UPI0037293FA1
MDWMTEAATRWLALAGAFFGVVGTMLSAWSHWERIKEARQKRKAARPKAQITLGEANANGWAPLQVRFWNEPGLRFEVIEAVTETKGVLIAPIMVQPNPPGQFLRHRERYADESRSGTKVSLTWKVKPHISPSVPAAKGQLFAKLRSTAAGSRSNELRISFRCRETSATREAFTISATTDTTPDAA